MWMGVRACIWGADAFNRLYLRLGGVGGPVHLGDRFRVRKKGVGVHFAICNSIQGMDLWVLIRCSSRGGGGGTSHCPVTGAWAQLYPHPCCARGVTFAAWAPLALPFLLLPDGRQDTLARMPNSRGCFQPQKKR